MHNRLRSHKMKMNHLSLIFERELGQMKTYCYNNVKNKKYKNMMLKLMSITDA